MRVAAFTPSPRDAYARGDTLPACPQPETAMNTRPNQDAPRDIDRRGEASGQHEPVRRPDHDQSVEQRLDDVSLEGRGDVLEDELRDRRSRGLPPDADRDVADDDR